MDWKIYTAWFSEVLVDKTRFPKELVTFSSPSQTFLLRSSPLQFQTHFGFLAVSLWFFQKEKVLQKSVHQETSTESLGGLCWILGSIRTIAFAKRPG